MDLFNLVASLSLDTSEYEYRLKDIDNSTGSSTSGISDKFKKLGGVIAKATAAMAAAAGAAVVKIGKDALTAYADYEQLEGGVKKLYGNMGMSVEEYAKSVNKSVDEINADWQRNEQAQALVMENARKGFQTTGLSANQYMEQATSFSAALINSLNGDTVAAAKQTDVAMRAIADNYNTFGGDMQNIQYAFQGFAKQNYTMLDNLKLGYGGTKTEMERLIADANEWAEANGMAADLSIDSFSDVVTAIDYIQQKQGIAGTTAREASTTIAGSIGMVKAAYENLISGLANPDADISQLVQDLVSSVGIAAGNVLPAVQQFAEGFGAAMAEIGPTIVQGIPKAISSMLPLLISSVGNMMSVMFQTMKSTLPQLLKVGQDIIKMITDGIKSNGSSFIEAGMNALMEFSETFRSGAGKLIEAGLHLVKTLAQAVIDNIPTFIQTVPTIISNFAGIVNDNMPKIIATGLSIIVSLVEGIIQAIPTLIANIPSIIRAIVDTLLAFGWASLGSKLITMLGNGMKAAGSLIINAVQTPISAVKTIIVSGLIAARDRAVSLMNSIKSAISDKINAAKDKVSGAVNKIKGFFPLKIGKIFSGMKLPHFTVHGGSPPYGLLGKGTKPSISVDWQPYKKAYDNPYLFNRPTGMVFGDGVGEEIVYGKQNLMRDISEAINNGSSNVDVEELGYVIGEIVGQRVTEALENVDIMLDRRMVGKFTRQATGVVL